MNYLKNYCDIVNHFKRVGHVKVARDGWSRHHIMPKCLGGSDRSLNIVVVPTRVHYLLHYILVKIYPGEYKICFAYFYMSHNGRNGKVIGSKEYARLRASINRRPLSVETKKKLSLANLGKHWSDESRLKMSSIMSKMPRHEAWRRHIGEANSRRVWSEASKEKGRLARLGVPATDHRVRAVRATCREKLGRAVIREDGVILLSVHDAVKFMNFGEACATCTLVNAMKEGWRYRGYYWRYLDESK